MPIDIQQLIQIFVEESLETLQEMEHALLALELSAKDSERIDLLFRYIHSIKSSSAVFGFSTISEFAHTLETFLDRVRSKKYQLNQEDKNLLLETTDSLQSVLTNIRNNAPLEDGGLLKLNDIFKAKILSPTKKPEDTKEQITSIKTHEPLEVKVKIDETKDDQGREIIGWYIIFHPNVNLFETGNDPLRLFSVLSDLGKLNVEADVNSIPDFPNFNPNLCYISWHLKLYGHIPKKEIEEVMLWIVSEENITILPIYSEPTLEKKAERPIEESEGRSRITSVRVTTTKIDNLINIVGELVIIKSMLNQIVENFDMSRYAELQEGLDYLAHNFSELQNSVMSIRMVPMEFIFNRIPRIVHDMAHKMNKKVDLTINGEQTELDKNLIDKLSDPLLHLVRNAIDHGIEQPALRKLRGKPANGTIALNAYQDGNSIVVDVSDDGAGLNKNMIRKKAIELGYINESETLSDIQIYDLVFHPGFTTAKNVTEVSGRGVGLDVVYKNVKALGGEIEVESKENIGSTFRMRLPLTLAIIDCQLVGVENQIYIIPLTTIVEIIRIDQSKLDFLTRQNQLYQYQENYVPIVFLNQIFSTDVEPQKHEVNDVRNKFLIILEMHEQCIGVIVDAMLSQQQVVIKNLEDTVGKIRGISGVTILRNGEIAFIVDVKAMIDIVLSKEQDKKTLQPKLDFIQMRDHTDLVTQILKKSNETLQILCFSLADRQFGVDVLDVKEIRILEKTTLVPNMPTYVKGVINARGDIIPIIDLLERLSSTDSIQHTSHTVAIIIKAQIQQKWRYIGIIVDQVNDIYELKYTDIQTLPEGSKKTSWTQYTYGIATIDNKMISLLDISNLFFFANEQESAS